MALSIFSLRTFTSHVERNTVNNLEQMVYYMGNNLNNIFSQYNEVTKLMYLSVDAGAIDGSTISTTDSVNVNERINRMSIDDFLTTVLYSDSFIKNAFFVRAMDGKVYRQSRDSKAFLPDLLPVDDWLEPLRSRPQQLAVIPTHEEPYFLDSSQKIVTLGRNLIDTSGLLQKEPKIVGTLFIDVNLQAFDELVKELNLEADGELIFVDGAGNVIFSNRGDEGTKVDLDRLRTGGVLTFSEEVPFLQGEVLVRISKSALYESLTTTRSTVIVAIVFCTVLLILMGIWFSRRLSNPIRRVIREMVKVESGNLDVAPLDGGKDEVGRLSHGFNRMVERLRTFIDEAYVAEIKQKQTELNALKSQIRPHYLYNTLEVIRMNAVANDDDEVGEMILSLSKQLKYVIDYGENSVPLRRELEHLRDYFYIIEVRFENRIELRVDIADNVDLDASILKLSLQPIVENAVQHGVLPKGGRGSVRITVENAVDDLVVTVYDDGVGMEPEELERLTSRLSGPSGTSKSIGMKNVHDRIRALYGPEYGLAVSSRKMWGTAVRMVVPTKQGGNGHDDSSAAGGR
ncbi:cache domain-containing sensor histidine kinase [Cohnella fermenti]|nr:sensor histidine kinase [Cohnella fermenti]